MTTGLETKLDKSARGNIDLIAANLERTRNFIHPEYLAQFERYKKSVIALLSDPANTDFSGDPQVLATIQASNEKVMAGLGFEEGNQATTRKRGVIRAASNDNWGSQEKAA